MYFTRTYVLTQQAANVNMAQKFNTKLKTYTKAPT